MRVINYSDFRDNLSQNLKEVNQDREILIVAREEGQSIVLMDLEEYNSIRETLHLTSSKTNSDRLDDAVNEMNEGKFLKHKLITR
jgi:antitoxin YefM